MEIEWSQSSNLFFTIFIFEPKAIDKKHKLPHPQKKQQPYRKIINAITVPIKAVMLQQAQGYPIDLTIWLSYLDRLQLPILFG